MTSARTEASAPQGPANQSGLGQGPVLEMRGVSKRFPGVKALDNVNLSVYAGEVHALMGENGAGKSTLMKILAGAYSADEGEILLNGQRVTIRSPQDAKRLGINLIYQELNLAPNLSVAENIFMGGELARAGLIRRSEMRARAREVLTTLGASFGPEVLAGRLSIAEQQQVEIARALYNRSQVLVMDEPTTALSDRETEKLFAIIRRLRAEGLAIIYISHRMAEVYDLSDRVSVLRDGAYVGSLARAELSSSRLVQMMVGRSLKDFYRHDRRAAAGEVVLEVRGLTDGKKVKPASLKVHAGEIVGLAGLVGAGRTELARLIFGADSKTDGEVRLFGQPVRITSPTEGVRAGVGYIPENRKEQGLFLEMSARENITMNVLGTTSRGSVLSFKELRGRTAQAIQDLNIRVANQHTRALSLSGGNQQKLLVARWLEIKPKVLLLDEPTRGVDVGAKGEIYRLMTELAARGVAILFISSELPEIIGMSDRVLVMREGELVGEVSDPAQITQETIISYATGASEVT